jgi:ABC-type branched-subunit amino acid transport system substrate-binding protein
VVKVGLVAPFEGRDRDVGYDAIYAARLAIREAAAATAGNETRVLLVALDDGGDPQLAREAAASLATDPDVMVVVGHWLPETTAAAAGTYQQAGLPLISLGSEPLVASDPATLPASFREAYAAVTPFSEVAGPYAGATYDGITLALRALELSESEGSISRQSVATALDRLQYQGLTGPVFRP